MSLTVKGVDEAARFFNWMGRKGLFKEELERYGSDVKSDAKPYVSKPSQSTYRRTMTLSRGWYHNAKPTSVTIGNRASYSGYVQQRATQAWMHRQHGWHTVEDRAESTKNIGAFRRACYAKVDRRFRRA